MSGVRLATGDDATEIGRVFGLGFEDACLEFHRSSRPVRTASSEQVRRPINRDGVGQWLPFEPWLEPLRAALGDLPETYATRPQS